MSGSLYILKHMLMPPCLILLLLLVGFFLVLLKNGRLGKVTLALGILIFYGFSINPTANRLLEPLEGRYPPLSAERLPRTGTLIVLGGGVFPGSALLVSSRLSEATARRLLEAVRLYQLMDRPQVVVCGGMANPFSQTRESEAMREVLLGLGIPPELIVGERESRDTYENAQAVREARPRRPLILITSARHMSRALGVFAALGMKPLPAPCDFRVHRDGDPSRYLPSATSLAASSAAVYEYLGTWWYELTGRL